MKMTLDVQPSEDLPYVVKVLVSLIDIQPEDRDRAIAITVHGDPEARAWLPSWHMVRDVIDHPIEYEFRALLPGAGHYLIAAAAYERLNFLAQIKMAYEVRAAP